MFVLVLKVNVNFRERTWNSSAQSQGWQEEGELGWTLLISSSIRESPRGQRGEVSSHAWDTLKATSWKWIACVIQDIWGPNQRYPSLIPLQRNPRESWEESSKVEQRKHRKPHDAESLLVKDQAAPCFHSADPCQEYSWPCPEGQMTAWGPRHLSALGGDSCQQQ